MALFNRQNDQGAVNQGYPDGYLDSLMEQKGATDAVGAAKSAEEQRIGNIVEQLEARVTTLYAAIGREYYDDCEDERGLSETMQANFVGIKDCKKNIDELNAKLRDIRGITTCPHCGADVNVNDIFCASCGKRIKEATTVQSGSGVCPNCHHPIAPGQQFCSGCGLRLNVEEPVHEEPAASHNRCAYCGAELDEGAVFCANCGQKQPDAPMTAQSAQARMPQMPNPLPSGNNAAMEDDNDKTVGISSGQSHGWDETKMTQPVGATAAAAPYQQPAPEPQSEFCPNCGAKLDPGDVFCMNCGCKVQ